MKTLLLALAVVAFMCLDSVYPLNCFQCNRETWWKCSEAKRCRLGNKCYNLYNSDGKWTVKGCAQTCPTAGPDERVKCCYISECNRY
uniref:Sulmotoxin 2 n=1 Tax=Spilotes sulphureus TaxID=1899469 RepID=3NB2_SPISL